MTFGDMDEGRTMRERLRERFPKEQIGRLPRTDKRPALDYVGHAAVTDRLNRYAPDWTYTIDKLFDHGNVTYIEGTMTIGGVSRVEYGDGKTPKEAIGNFIRRGAMRFGVALDLWSKEELEDVPAASGVPHRGEAAPEPVADPSSSVAAGANAGEVPDDPSIVGVPTSPASTSGEVGEGYGEGSEPTSSVAPSVLLHRHGNWIEAPRKGFVICQAKLPNGKVCGYAEKGSLLTAVEQGVAPSA